MTLDDEPSLFQQRARLGPIGFVPDLKPGVERRGVDTQARLTLLAASQTGYRNLCRLATAAARVQVSNCSFSPCCGSREAPQAQRSLRGPWVCRLRAWFRSACPGRDIRSGD